MKELLYGELILQKLKSKEKISERETKLITDNKNYSVFDFGRDYVYQKTQKLIVEFNNYDKKLAIVFSVQVISIEWLSDKEEELTEEIERNVVNNNDYDTFFIDLKGKTIKNIYWEKKEIDTNIALLVMKKEKVDFETKIKEYVELNEIFLLTSKSKEHLVEFYFSHNFIFFNVFNFNKKIEVKNFYFNERFHLLIDNLVDDSSKNPNLIKTDIRLKDTFREIWRNIHELFGQ